MGGAAVPGQRPVQGGRGGVRGVPGTAWGREGRGPVVPTCQTDLDAGAVPTRPGVRHLPPAAGRPRIQCRRPPARPGPAPPPPPQGYGHGLGAGVRAGTPSERRRRRDGGRGLEPQDRALGCAAARSRPWPAQHGAAALAAGRPPPSLLPPPPPELRARPLPCRPGPARPRACVRARARGARRYAGRARPERAREGFKELQGFCSRWGSLKQTFRAPLHSPHIPPPTHPHTRGTN